MYHLVEQDPFKKALHLFLLSSRAKQRQWELLRESRDLAHFLARTRALASSKQVTIQSWRAATDPFGDCESVSPDGVHS
jgi:hypothetical protein